MSNIVESTGKLPKRGRVVDYEPEIPNLRNDWRSPEGVKGQIAKHVAAREAYAKAVAPAGRAGPEGEAERLS
jgi:hypothetical protein